MATHDLNLPVTTEQIEQLRIGDEVTLSGTVYTARDIAHLGFQTCLREGHPLPINLEGRALFHAGPVVRRKGDRWELVAIGPTTSIRMEPYADMVGQLGVKLIIGKGGLSQGSQEAFRRYRQAYLQAAPGCAVLLAKGVKKVVDALWLENGMPEAVWTLEVERFGPFIVTMDAEGNSRYDSVRQHARKVIQEILN